MGADCLDALVAPVPYRWYHRIGCIFGNRRSLALREECCNSGFTVDLAQKRIQTDTEVRRAVEKSASSLLTLKKAAIEKKPLDRNTKEELMRDIYYAEFLKHSEEICFSEAEDRASEVSLKNRDCAELNGMKSCAIVRQHHDYLAKDQLISKRNESIAGSYMNEIQCEKKMNQFSKTTELLLDPQKGKENFLSLYDCAVTNHASFGDMEPEYLLKEAEKAENNVFTFTNQLVKQKEEAALSGLKKLPNGPQAGKIVQNGILEAK